MLSRSARSLMRSSAPAAWAACRLRTRSRSASSARRRRAGRPRPASPPRGSPVATPGRAVTHSANMLAPPTIGKTKTLDVLGQALLAHEARVQARGAAGAEDVGGHVERVEGIGPERRHAVGEVDARQRHLVGHSSRARRADAAARPSMSGGAWQVRVARDRPEVAAHHLEGRIGLEVAGDGEDRVVRRVVGREELAARRRARRPTGPPSSRWSSGGTGGRPGRRGPACARPSRRRAGCRRSSGARSSPRRAGCRASPGSSPAAGDAMRSASSQSASSSSWPGSVSK